jgi:hypothetical protein
VVKRAEEGEGCTRMQWQGGTESVKGSELSSGSGGGGGSSLQRVCMCVRASCLSEQHSRCSALNSHLAKKRSRSKGSSSCGAGAPAAPPPTAGGGSLTARPAVSQASPGIDGKPRTLRTRKPEVRQKAES